MLIAPHPDDETLGCGGAVINMMKEQCDVIVVLLSDGNGGGRKNNIAQLRKQEFFMAQQVLKYTDARHLNLPDSYLLYHVDTIAERISQYIEKHKPSMVLVPYLFDTSPDHTAANYAVAKALKTGWNVTVGMYEVWTPILYPNCYINITNQFKQKTQAALCYQSQEKYYGICKKMNALNAFRAAISSNYRSLYTECYLLLSCSDYIHMTKQYIRLRKIGDKFDHDSD